MSNSLSGNHSEKEKEHKERIRKLKAKTSKMRVAVVSISKDKKYRENKIDKFLESPGQTKRFLSESQKHSPKGSTHKQMPEGKANQDYMEKGIKINPSKHKGKRINTNLKKKFASKSN